MSEFCTNYHCAGDCGLRGHGVQHFKPKTIAQRQAKHKAEQAALGIKEVRGVMAHVDIHKAVRKAARKQIAAMKAFL